MTINSHFFIQKRHNINGFVKKRVNLLRTIGKRKSIKKIPQTEITSTRGISSQGKTLRATHTLLHTLINLSIYLSIYFLNLKLYKKHQGAASFTQRTPKSN